MTEPPTLRGITTLLNNDSLVANEDGWVDIGSVREGGFTIQNESRPWLDGVRDRFINGGSRLLYQSEYRAPASDYQNYEFGDQIFSRSFRTDQIYPINDRPYSVSYETEIPLHEYEQIVGFDPGKVKIQKRDHEGLIVCD